ncbi:MAG: DUF4962 domain-containing protein [Gammaproteobacteria bacterium]|nr:DUF4962 domain-containing protein [Gammaproteobacteria bacterium]
MLQHKESKKEPVKLDEPRAGRLNIGYSPDLSTEITENPPRFTWMPVIEDEASYILRVSTDPQFENADTEQFTDISINFFTPDKVLAPGTYYWSYAVWSAEEQMPSSTWSQSRQFTITNGLPETPIPQRATRVDSFHRSHPRLWLNNDTLSTFANDVSKSEEHCGWQAFFEKSVKPWTERDVMKEPSGYPEHKRVASIWRQTYIDCQELLYAIRHLAIAGKVKNDTELLASAKAWLLEAANWDPNGTTARTYTDEWAFRVALALAWGYDWLYDELNESERKDVQQALLLRTREIADHIIYNARIQLFPYDSHAVRAVSAVLIPASIALLHEEEEAEAWLNYSIEFLATVYSPWGDSDGGWAEGPHYWMTGIAYLVDAANLLRNYTDIDLYQRPFFQKTGDFPVFTKPPDIRRATFGDDSTMGDLPCLKLGYNVRQFAGVTGNGIYQWYFEEIKRNDPGTEMAFYNWGWWDLNFDDMVYRHDFADVEPVAPSDIPKLRVFSGIGWAAIQHNMHKPDQHISFIFKSSPFGSISHSHGDQNAFCLSAFGEDLAIQSGHYVAFNSSMHQLWRRQTRSKNALLINGLGQYADKDKSRTLSATGFISNAEQHDDHIFVSGDATLAYQSLNKAISKVQRDIYFVYNEYFVIVDTVDAEEPVDIDWRLHANGPMQLGDSTFRYSGDKAGFYGQVIWSEAGPGQLTQKTGFEDVDPVDYEGLPESTCLNVRFPRAARHRIAVLLVPYPVDTPKRIFNFLDDQGYDCDLYFSDADERSFRIVIPKSFHVGR